MELFVLNGELATVGILDCVSEMVLTRHFFTPASLKLTLTRGAGLPAGAEYLYEGKSGECIVIESVTNDGDGFCQVCGRGVECLLERRVIAGNRVYYGTAEFAVRSALTEALAHERTIPHVVLGDATGGIDGYGHHVGRWEVLSRWIYGKLRPYRASYRLKLDPKLRVLRFSVVKGVDRTPNQTDRPAVVFSDSLGNIGPGEIKKDTEKLYNTAYAVGNDGTYAVVSAGDGPRRELYVSARDIFRSSFASDEEYFEALAQKGREELAAATGTLSLAGAVSGDPGCEYVCGVDYDLGDLCRIGFGGTYADVTVTTVRDVRCGGERRLEAVFGEL